MLISNRQALQDRVVELLGAAPALTALELQESLGEHARECTLQAVYQELRKLIAAGVVVKTGQHYSLRIAWLLEILAFADKAYLSHLTNATVVELLPEENDSSLAS